jgi:tellurite methyltransferase
MDENAMSVTQYWDNMYRDLTAPVTFGGGKPSDEVVAAAKRLEAGARALDIGSGDGRNALFLASLGMHVTAVDNSPVGIAKTLQFAKERGLAVTTHVEDMRHLVLDADYDLIVSMGCLHLIEREYWQPLLRLIQTHTRVGGYNAIGVITDALPAPDDQREHFIGLFHAGELRSLYAGWEIISDQSVQFHDEHPNRAHHHHAGETILARKV